MLRHEEEVFEEMYDRFPDEYSQVGGNPTNNLSYISVQGGNIISA